MLAKGHPCPRITDVPSMPPRQKRTLLSLQQSLQIGWSPRCSPWLVPLLPSQGLGWPFLPPHGTSTIFHHSGTKSLKGRAIIRASPSHREHCKATNDRDRQHWTSLLLCSP